MIQPRDVAALVQSFDPTNDGEAEKSRELTLALLGETERPFSRHQFAPGHITCTGLVLNPARDSILLVLHRRLQRWLLPGGHVEPDDPHIGAAAAREVIEETGAVLRGDPNPPLVGIDVHPIPPRPGEVFHLHHDLIFGFQAETEEFRLSEEVREVVWCPANAFDRYQLPNSIRGAHGRALSVPAGPRYRNELT